MPNMDLLVRVSDLAALRRVAAEKKQALAEKQAAFDAEHADEVRLAKAAEQSVASAETALKAVALALYEADKDKNRKLAPGVSVKLFGVIEYDAALALVWAKDKKMALNPESLNAVAFKEIAAASPTSFDFVSFTTDPRVEISKDLDKALSSAEAAADASQVAV